MTVYHTWNAGAEDDAPALCGVVNPNQDPDGAPPEFCAKCMEVVQLESGITVVDLSNEDAPPEVKALAMELLAQLRRPSVEIEDAIMEIQRLRAELDELTAREVARVLAEGRADADIRPHYDFSTAPRGSVRSLMEYKGYRGTALVSMRDRVLHGRIVLAVDVVNYEAQTIDGLELAFRAAVDDYVAQRGKA